MYMTRGTRYAPHSTGAAVLASSHYIDTRDLQYHRDRRCVESGHPF
jgi:hypothetical protein